MFSNKNKTEPAPPNRLNNYNRYTCPHRVLYDADKVLMFLDKNKTEPAPQKITSKKCTIPATFSQKNGINKLR